MPRLGGIRIWRFRDGRWKYRTSSQNREDQDLAPDRVAAPRAPAKDDWLLQRLSAADYNKEVKRIAAGEVVAQIADSRIPKDGDVWYWDGEEVSRVYVRSAQVDEEDREKKVEAAVVHEDDAQVIFFRGVGKPCFVYHCADGTWEDVELEETSGTLELIASGGENEGLLEPAESALLLLAKQLADSQEEIRKAIRAAQGGDDESALRLVVKVVGEVLMGAEPAPVQGHNVAHSLPGLIDNLEKLDALVRCRESLSKVSDSNRSGATGDFGTGVGLVDGTWQSVGSLIAFFKSVADTAQFKGTSKEDRSAAFGANARSRHALTVAEHASKAASTTAAAVEAIGKVASFATAVPAPLVPSVGALTGLIATARSSVQAEKTRRRMGKLKRLLEKNKGTIDEPVQRLLAYGMRKAKRKFATKTAEATTAAFGSVGSTVLIVGAVVAGANAWNPVGWGIGAAVFVAGAGLLTYKIVRKVTSESRAEKRGFSRAEFPLKLLDEYASRFARNPNSSETVVLHEMLRAYGVNPLDVLTRPTEEVPRARDRIARHLSK